MSHNKSKIIISSKSQNPVKISINAKYSKANNNRKILPINSVEYCLVLMFIQRFCSTKVQQNFVKLYVVYDKIKQSSLFVEWQQIRGF